MDTPKRYLRRGLIEIGQLGTYGTASCTAFNGFDKAFVAEAANTPFLMNPAYTLTAARAA